MHDLENRLSLHQFAPINIVLHWCPILKLGENADKYRHGLPKSYKICRHYLLLTLHTRLTLPKPVNMRCTVVCFDCYDLGLYSKLMLYDHLLDTHTTAASKYDISTACLVLGKSKYCVPQVLLTLQKSLPRHELNLG